MQSLEAGTDFCGPEIHKHSLYQTENMTLNWLLNCNHVHTIRQFTSQSWYNWRRGWYSLERSIRKSMRRSMQRGSASGSKLIRRRKDHRKMTSTRLGRRIRPILTHHITFSIWKIQLMHSHMHRASKDQKKMSEQKTVWIRTAKNSLHNLIWDFSRQLSHNS